MTDELMRGIAAQMANMVRTELRNRGTVGMVLAAYIEGEGLRRMRKLERLIAHTFGEDWLNDGAAKEVAFSALREAFAVLPPHAAALANVSNQFEPTAKFLALPEDQQRTMALLGGPLLHDCVAAGYFTMHDALTVTVQTPERVCIYVQRVEGRLVVGEPRIGFGPQSAYFGRTKMFGEETEAEA